LITAGLSLRWFSGHADGAREWLLAQLASSSDCVESGGSRFCRWIAQMS
jgi:hypothetical protein